MFLFYLIIYVQQLSDHKEGKWTASAKAVLIGYVRIYEIDHLEVNQNIGYQKLFFL